MDSTRYSEEANTMYVKISKDKRHIAQTLPMGNDRFMDIDEAGHVLGIEILLSNTTPEEAYEAIKRTESIKIST